MGWRVHLQGDDGHEYTSASLTTREEALGFACDFVRDGDLQILEIINEHGDKIGSDEVILFSEASKLARAGRARV